MKRPPYSSSISGSLRRFPKPAPKIMETTAFTDGQVVKIDWPHKKYDGCKARFLDYGTDHHAWLSLDKKFASVQPPDERVYRKRDAVNHILVPLSRIQAI